MKPARASLIALIASYLLAGLSACDSKKDSHEKAAKDLVAAMSDLNGILDDVKDESSAASAASQIDAVAGKVKGVAERLKTLPSPKASENEAIKKKYEPQIKKEGEKFQANVQRIVGIPGVREKLMGPMMEVQSAFMDLSFAGMQRSRPNTTPPGGRPPGSPSGPPGAGPGQRGPGMQPSMSFEERVQSFKDQHGADKVVKIEVTNLPDKVDHAKLANTIKTLVGATTYTASHPANGLNIYVAPAADLSAVSRKINFGKVTATDAAARTIKVEAEAGKVPTK